MTAFFHENVCELGLVGRAAELDRALGRAAAAWVRPTVIGVVSATDRMSGELDATSSVGRSGVRRSGS